MPPPASMSDTISGFDPRSVTGCQLWLDASDTSTLTGSSPVTSWRNKIVPSNNTPVFATSAGSPSISATAINGKPAMYFNGSSYFTGAISGANTTTITVFIVGSLISPFGGFSGLLCFGNPSQLDYDNVGSLPITMYNDQFKIYGARNSSSQPTPILANVPFLYVLQYDGAFINTWLNGTQQTDPSINIASSGTFTYTNYSVAARAGTISGQYLWSGYFGEILVYQSAVNTTDRQRIEGYLGWKWGIESMPFMPGNISGLAMWLDGADRTTLFTDTSATTTVTADGNTIAAWRDKSTNAYLFTQATAGSRPTYKTSILNGKSITRWNGTSTFLQSSATLPFYTSSTSGGSFFVVFMATTVASQRFLMTYQNQVANTYCGTESELGYTTGNGGQGNFGLHQGCSRATVAATGTIVTNSYVLMSYVLSTTGTTPANSTIFKNGVSLTPANDQTGFYSAGSYPSANNARFLNIGARVFNGVQATDCWHSGDIAEIIWYRTPLSTTERQGIESYLSSKWNISVPTQALPLTHPFATIRPFTRQFSPIDIPECLFWWDAADGSTITRSGTQVTSWRNKGSWNGSAVSRVGVVTSGTATFNGLNIVQFPVGTELGFTVAIPNQARAWFAVFRQTSQVTVSGPNFRQYFAIINQTQGSGQDSAFGPGVPTTQGTTTYLMAEGPSGNPNGVSTGNTVPDGFNVMKQYAWINSAVSTASNFNNVDGTSYTLTTNNIATAYRTDSVTYTINTNWYNNSCDLAEILFYNSEISTSQRQQIEGYLAWKWRIQSSLVSGHPYTRLPPSSAIPFLPINFSGCTVWLDAVDPNGTGAQPTNGSTISTWVDKSGNSKDMTIYAGTPVFNINPSRITFNGSTSLINSTFTSQIFTLFIVYLQTTATAPVFVTSSTLEYSGLWPNEGGTVYFDRGGNNWYTQASTFPINTRRILVIQYTANGTGASMFVWSDGTLSISTTSLGARTVTALLLGSRPSTSAFLTGNYNEVIQYDSVLTTVQRQKIEGYLASKWGLTSSLPTIHPYRQFEPAQESYIPILAPGTPVSLVASNTVSTFNMSWTTGSGGTPVTYTVTVYAGASLVATQTITHPTISSTYSPMTVSVAYTFYVSATNTGGTSAVAGPSSSVTYTAGATYTFSATLLGFPATTGYTVYTGGFTSIDDGYSSTPLTLPVAFSTNAQSSSLLYMSTNGFFTLGSGSGSIVSSPQQSANPAFMAGNPGDNWIQSGLVNSDGDTQNWWYQTGSSGGKSFVKNLVLCGTYGNSTFAKSYIDNFYRDSTYQWYETRVKSNTAGSTGPYNAASVVQPASTTSKVWRGDLNGQNWVYLGAGSVV